MTYIYVAAKRSLSALDGYIRLDHCSFSQRRLFCFSHLLYSRTSSYYNRSRQEKQRGTKLITHCNSDNENLIPLNKLTYLRTVSQAQITRTRKLIYNIRKECRKKAGLQLKIMGYFNDF